MPAVRPAPESAHRRFELPKGRGAEVHCTLDASIGGWEQGRYAVRFRAGYPCTTGENPKAAVLEVACWNGSCYFAVKTGYVDTVRHVFATSTGVHTSDLVVEFSDGTPSLLISVPHSERKELERLLEIARHNGRA